MKIILEIPDKYVNEYEADRFSDSLSNVSSDLDWCHNISGYPEHETVDMLHQALLHSERLVTE